MKTPAQPGEFDTWKLVVSYDGTDFSGWQIQPGRPTIQGELQAALGRVVGESPLPQGSGRTDAGVHALAQVASFQLRAPIPPDSLRRALNRTLPQAIRVLAANKVGSDFHARHSAVAKTYEYQVFLERRPQSQQRTVDCPPFLARYVYSYPWPLNLDTLQAAARRFIGTHDFLSFAATDPDLAARSGPNPTAAAEVDDKDFSQPGSIRTIFGSWWEQAAVDGALFIYRVRGNGFLHHMVRNLVGTFLLIGKGSLKGTELGRVLQARSRSANPGATAPACGLYLVEVEY